MGRLLARLHDEVAGHAEVSNESRWGLPSKGEQQIFGAASHVLHRSTCYRRREFLRRRVLDGVGPSYVGAGYRPTSQTGAQQAAPHTFDLG
jgi:hypothetical protein